MRGELEYPLVVNPSVVVQRMASGAILMDSVTGDCFELNAVGVEVWNEIERGIPPAEIIAAVAKNHRVDASRVAADIRSLLSNLHSHGIVSSPSR